MTNFRRFLQQAQRLTAFQGIDVAKAMDVMEPLPLGVSWKMFLDIYENKPVMFDHRYYTPIYNFCFMLLNVLEVDGYLALDGKTHPTVPKDYHVEGRFVYTESMKVLALSTLEHYVDADDPRDDTDDPRDDPIESDSIQSVD